LAIGGNVCGGLSGEIGQAQESANCLDARWWLDFDAEQPGIPSHLVRGALCPTSKLCHPGWRKKRQRLIADAQGSHRCGPF
jgi:hypothetical protein